jgi:predicted dehydrogenase
MLDTSHGADYFRRWHREKKRSGGLLVHKATHHFDLVNWWLDTSPLTVFAMGDLRFYGRSNAIARGDEHLTGYGRYTGHPNAETDPFALWIDGKPNRDEGRVWDKEGLRALYYEAEDESGYIRDRNVFDSGIDIEDTLSVMVRYKSGALLNYSLLAYSPWEGFDAAITGDRGRIEVSVRGETHIPTCGRKFVDSAKYRVQLHRMFGPSVEIEFPPPVGGHGGGDAAMLADIFGGSPSSDPFGRAATYSDAAASLAIGICGNESIASGQAVNCDDVLRITTTAKSTSDYPIRKQP